MKQTEQMINEDLLSCRLAIKNYQSHSRDNYLEKLMDILAIQIIWNKGGHVLNIEQRNKRYFIFTSIKISIKQSLKASILFFSPFLTETSRVSPFKCFYPNIIGRLRQGREW